MTARRPRASVRVLATFAAIVASALASGPATAGSDTPARSFSINETAILAGTSPHRSSGVASASGAGARPSERSIQYRGRVRGGADGTGATAASFPTTAAGHPNGLRLIALHAIDAGQYRIVIGASGPPRAGARIEILAVRV